MKENLVYRRLTEEDCHLVLALNSDLRPGFAAPDNVREFLANTMNWFVACIHEQQIVGFAYGYELQRLNNIGNMLYIHEVGVLEPFQSQGIGTRLIEKIKTAGKESGICRFFLATERSNTKACGLYKKTGNVEAHPDDIIYYYTDFASTPAFSACGKEQHP